MLTNGSLKRLLEVRRSSARALTSLTDALRRSAPKAIPDIAREALPGAWRERVDSQWLTTALLPVAPGILSGWPESKILDQIEAAAKLTRQWNVDRRLFVIGMENVRAWTSANAQILKLAPEHADNAMQAILLAEAMMCEALELGSGVSVHKELVALRASLNQSKAAALYPEGATTFSIDADTVARIADRVEKGIEAREKLIARMHARAQDMITAGMLSQALSVLEQVELQNLRMDQTKDLLEELAEAHAIKSVELSMISAPAGVAGDSSVSAAPHVEENSTVLSPDEESTLADSIATSQEDPDVEGSESDLIKIDDPDEVEEDRQPDAFHDTSTGDLSADAINVAAEFDSARYHWMVTTELDIPRGYPLPYMLDEAIRFGQLEIRRDVAVFNPQILGVLPQRGLHEIFISQGKNVNWADAFRGWLTNHERKLQSFFERSAGVLVDHQPRIGLAVIGRLGWQATYELTNNSQSPTDDPLAYDSDYLDDWEDLIGSINKTWDVQFCRQMGWEIPDGTTGFADLEGGQKRKHAKRKLLSNSWNYFSCALFLWTLRTCKRLFPQARWAFLGYPLPLSLADPTDVNAKMVVHQRINDKLKWLWQAQDAIVPNLLAHSFTIADGKKPDMARKQNNTSLDRKAVEYNIREAIRLRDQFAKGKPVLSAHTYTYPASSKNVPLNDINIDHQFKVPLECGVDGVLIRGHISSRSQIEALQTQINGRLGKVIDEATKTPRG